MSVEFSSKSIRYLFVLLCCLGMSGCELPRGPMNFEPLHEKMTNFRDNIFGHEQAFYGEGCNGQACCDSHAHHEKIAAPPVANGPTYGGPSDAVIPPWPHYLPVPTRPVFEPSDAQFSP